VAAKRDALLGWAGLPCDGDGAQPCPMNGARPAGLGASDAPIWSMHSIQITYRPGRPLEAAAYIVAGRGRSHGAPCCLRST
jgi:hypothetical protein